MRDVLVIFAARVVVSVSPPCPALGLASSPSASHRLAAPLLTLESVGTCEIHCAAQVSYPIALGRQQERTVPSIFDADVAVATHAY